MNDVRMKGFKSRASVIEARTLICERTAPLGLERVPFRTAGGRILAEDVVADRNVPPHDRSAMDGYAVRAEDVLAATDSAVTLKVIGEIKAAEQLEKRVAAGEAVRVMTGAKIPDGASAVIMVEDTEDGGDTVVIKRSASDGQHILKTGEDLMANKPVLSAGRTLRPQDISMLVTVGALEVAVQRKPRVRIVPTGTELVRAGQKPTGSEVVESNSFLLEGLALRDGADPVLHPIVQDDRETLTRVLTEPGADLIVVTGGSSVGKEDYAPVIVRELGELPIHGVHVKPASPTGIGFIQGRPGRARAGLPGGLLCRLGRLCPLDHPAHAGQAPGSYCPRSAVPQDEGGPGQGPQKAREPGADPAGAPRGAARRLAQDPADPRRRRVAVDGHSGGRLHVSASRRVLLRCGYRAGRTPILERDLTRVLTLGAVPVTALFRNLNALPVDRFTIAGAIPLAEERWADLDVPAWAHHRGTARALELQKGDIKADRLELDDTPTWPTSPRRCAEGLSLLGFLSSTGHEPPKT